MDTASISYPTNPARGAAVGSGRAPSGARPAPAAATATQAAPGAAASKAPPPTDAPPALKVETARDEASGAQVTKVVDGKTGELIYQIPAEQVLNVVTQLLKLAHDREQAHVRIEH